MGGGGYTFRGCEATTTTKTTTTTNAATGTIRILSMFTHFFLILSSLPLYSGFLSSLCLFVPPPAPGFLEHLKSDDANNDDDVEAEHAKNKIVKDIAKLCASVDLGDEVCEEDHQVGGHEDEGLVEALKNVQVWCVHWLEADHVAEVEDLQEYVY